jgi:hypothetical protein
VPAQVEQGGGDVFRCRKTLVVVRSRKQPFVGDFFAIEESGPRCLNKFPVELARTRS